MLAVFIFLLVLVLFELVAVRFGVDSRDGDDWFYRRHNHPGGAPRLPT